VCPDEREHVVDRRDTVASDLLIEKLGLDFVDGRCRQRYVNAAVIEGREFNSEELNVSDGRGTATREFTGLYVKHQFLRLAPPESETIRAAAYKTEICKK
jgi:hypothetical protein